MSDESEIPIGEVEWVNESRRHRRRRERQERDRLAMDRATAHLDAAHPDWHLTREQAEDYIRHTLIGAGYLISVHVDDIKAVLAADLRRLRSWLVARWPR